MHDPHTFLKAVTLVLCAAAVTTIVFHRLRQPVVLGYVLAGMLIGPHTPFPLVVDENVVRTLSELGVILLMFSLGLEFRLGKVVKVGATSGIAAVIETGLMIWLGFITGRLFGWTARESLFAGALVAISSTTIVAKAFEELRVTGRIRELVVGILIFEDLIAILLLATLTAISTGSGLSASQFAWTTGRLVAFLIGLLSVGMLVLPRLMRGVTSLKRPETTVVASVGICFAIALLAQHFGYSVALGAFIAGSLVAESGRERQIEALIIPVRDIFAAIFFVSVGLMIDPVLILHHWFAVVALTLVVLFGKVLGVTLGSFMSGSGIRTSVQAGMSLAQIGEFSFIIAGLGTSLHATREFLYPVAVAVSAITTLTTPWFIRASGPVASFVDRKLPKPLQTFAALYATWIDQLKQAHPRQTLGASLRRWILLLAGDAALLIGWIITAALSMRSAVHFLMEQFGFRYSMARTLDVIVVILIGVPFGIGILQLSGRIGRALAEAAIPPRPQGRADPGTAPRRALMATLQLLIVLVVGIPVVAVSQPFLQTFPAWLVLLVAVGVLGVSVWRSTTNLQGHVRAGAQVIVDLLAAQSQPAEAGGPAHAQVNPHALDAVEAVLPGLGEPVPMTVEPASRAAGKSLSQLNLRGLTGATVLTVQREGQSVVLPTAHEVLQPGDIVSLAGSREAVEAARAFFVPG